MGGDELIMDGFIISIVGDRVPKNMINSFYQLQICYIVLIWMPEASYLLQAQIQVLFLSFSDLRNFSAFILWMVNMLNHKDWNFFSNTRYSSRVCKSHAIPLEKSRVHNEKVSFFIWVLHVPHFFKRTSHLQILGLYKLFSHFSCHHPHHVWFICSVRKYLQTWCNWLLFVDTTSGFYLNYRNHNLTLFLRKSIQTDFAIFCQKVWLDCTGCNRLILRRYKTQLYFYWNNTALNIWLEIHGFIQDIKDMALDIQIETKIVLQAGNSELGAY